MTDNCRPNNQNGVIEPRSDRTWSQATEICYQEDVMPGSIPLKLTASESTILETEEIEADSVSDYKDSDGESNRSNSFKRSVKEIKLKEHDRDSGGSCNSDLLKRMPMIKPEPTLDEESGEEAHEVKKPLSNGNGAIHLNTALWTDF